jgi:hypothetical protein
VREVVLAPEHGAAANASEPRLRQVSENEAVARLERLIGDELARILEGVYLREAASSRLGDLGLSSLGAVQLRSCLQRWVGVPLPLSIVTAEKTAHELAVEAWSYAARAA